MDRGVIKEVLLVMGMAILCGLVILAVALLLYPGNCKLPEDCKCYRTPKMCDQNYYLVYKLGNDSLYVEADDLTTVHYGDPPPIPENCTKSCCRSIMINIEPVIES